MFLILLQDARREATSLIRSSESIAGHPWITLYISSDSYVSSPALLNVTITQGIIESVHLLDICLLVFRWIFTSDTLIRKASRDEVFSSRAYMLFYERIVHSDHSNCSQWVANKMMRRELPTLGFLIFSLACCSLVKIADTSGLGCCVSDLIT